MLATLKTPPNRAPRAGVRGLKNRTGVFCRRSATRAPVLGSQMPKLRRVAKLAATKSASGPSLWPNRDPINEQGAQLTRTIMPDGDLGEESNLYRYVGNEPLGRFDPWGLAYFAYRPLDSAAGKLLGVTGNKLDDRMNTMAAHEQLFFEDKKSPGNLGFFDDNQVRSDTSSLKYDPAHDSGWNDCVMRQAAANVKPTTYCLLGKPGKTEKYNCQDWLDAVRAEYRRLIKDATVISTCCPTDAEKKK